ncbi:hypothetical protein E2C01_021971 [Portunus trituberculatus]|uniref:Uncharacterized protein n=1 Tax=Portunus trituberculatus TaxID=210409 RepID=A0A5B7E469_PORTR|nr:hypothetical protein [Portunus trituberculatus]
MRREQSVPEYRHYIGVSSSTLAQDTDQRRVNLTAAFRRSSVHLCLVEYYESVLRKCWLSLTHRNRDSGAAVGRSAGLAMVQQGSSDGVCVSVCRAC